MSHTERENFRITQEFAEGLRSDVLPHLRYWIYSVMRRYTVIPTCPVDLPSQCVDNQRPLAPPLAMVLSS